MMTSLAIIGAGIGGCSTAYFARKHLPYVNVTIYDAQDRIGGRILSCKATDAALELGATFFSSFNKTLLEIVNAEHLKTAPVERRDFAVWNGSEFIFRSNKQSYATDLKLMAKYKRNLIQTFLLLQKVKGQIDKLYQELKNSADISEIFESTGLDRWHQKPFSEILIESGINQDFIDEVVTPITRTIYSQNADLGGFAGFSSLIGVYSGKTYRLAEGNSTLPMNLAQVSNAAVKLGQTVNHIEKMPNCSYRLYSGEDSEVFDNVIIATPLELTDIEFDSVNKPDWEPQPYQTVYRKVMRGIFNPAYFGLKNSVTPPVMVLTTKDAGPITHYSIQKTNNDESLVTFSSLEPLNSKTLNGIFKKDGTTVLEHCWKAAYPKFKPLTKLPPTRIDERLMYVNAVESAVSSMETSALSSLNAVRMLGKEAHG